MMAKDVRFTEPGVVTTNNIREDIRTGEYWVDMDGDVVWKTEIGLVTLGIPDCCANEQSSEHAFAYNGRRLPKGTVITIVVP